VRSARTRVDRHLRQLHITHSNTRKTTKGGTKLNKASFIQRLSDDNVFDCIENSSNVACICGTCDVRVDLLVRVAISAFKLLLQECRALLKAVISSIIREIFAQWHFLDLLSE